jgi:hypothetical protein
MHDLRMQWLRRLHPRRIDPSIGVIAGLASAVSVIVGLMAQNALGHVAPMVPADTRQRR